MIFFKKFYKIQNKIMLRNYHKKNNKISKIKMQLVFKIIKECFKTKEINHLLL